MISGGSEAATRDAAAHLGGMKLRSTTRCVGICGGDGKKLCEWRPTGPRHRIAAAHSDCEGRHCARDRGSWTFMGTHPSQAITMGARGTPPTGGGCGDNAKYLAGGLAADGGPDMPPKAVAQFSDAR